MQPKPPDKNPAQPVPELRERGENVRSFTIWQYEGFVVFVKEMTISVVVTEMPAPQDTYTSLHFTRGVRGQLQQGGFFRTTFTHIFILQYTFSSQKYVQMLGDFTQSGLLS